MKYNKILKPKKFDYFTIIPSSIFRHKNITVGATGLYAYLFSHTAEQEITIQFICGHFKEGKDAIAAKIKELIEAGYLERVRVTDKGKFKGYNYILKSNQNDCRFKYSSSNATLSEIDNSSRPFTCAQPVMPGLRRLTPLLFLKLIKSN